ncbi:MAG: DUF1559 domain-containing protein [Capsulimonadaceae bacterium]|nr:DUF1559 domain-containing protein [Capsulimonadaceae bacterium]
MTRSIQSRGNQSAAFTLIELLVVIAIIAILAAILFPVFATAREKARQASCASNLKQMGIAFIQYEQDYDETMTCTLPGYMPGAGWAGLVYPYVKSQNVYQCPDDQTPSAAPPNTPLFISYGFNANLAARSLSQFGATAKTVLEFEVAGNAGSQGCDPSVVSSCAPTGYGFSAMNYDPSGRGATGTGICTSLTTTVLRYATGPFYHRSQVTNSCYDPSARHSQGSNFLMADGHVKWLLGTQVSTGIAFYTGEWIVAASNYQDQNPPNIWGAGTPAGTEGAFNSGGTLTPAATFSPY